jgi:hypothetical protein
MPDNDQAVSSGFTEEGAAKPARVTPAGATPRGMKPHGAARESEMESESKSKGRTPASPGAAGSAANKTAQYFTPKQPCTTQHRTPEGAGSTVSPAAAGLGLVSAARVPKRAGVSPSTAAPPPKRAAGGSAASPHGVPSIASFFSRGLPTGLLHGMPPG